MKNLDSTTKTGPKRRRWGFWLFVLVNVAGGILAIPLLSAVFPLLGIWWDTRSEQSFLRHEQRSAQLSMTNSAATAAKFTAVEPTPPADPSLGALTNSLHLLANLKEEELNKIVAYQFGKQKQSKADPAKFDRDAAVFHAIKRTIQEIDGKRHYCYAVDWVDPNGNHESQLDCFEKPDLDYERSIATLELVNGNPQLKKIYQAFAHVLGEQSAAPEQAQTAATDKKAELRIEPEAMPDRP
jgi:hypothetical protein